MCAPSCLYPECDLNTNPSPKMAASSHRLIFSPCASIPPAWLQLLAHPYLAITCLHITPLRILRRSSLKAYCSQAIIPMLPTPTLPFPLPLPPTSITTITRPYAPIPIPTHTPSHSPSATPTPTPRTYFTALSSPPLFRPHALSTTCSCPSVTAE